MKENFYPRISKSAVLISSVLLIFWYARNVWTHAMMKHRKPAEIAGDVGTKPDVISDSTRSSIYQTIANREYNITEDKKQGVLQSPNRKQNLRAYYEPGKLTVRNRVDSAGHNFRLTLKNAGVFADGKKLFAPQPTAAKETSDSKLLLRHEGFTEEFINTEAGIRQNFIIQQAPKNTKSLQVRLEAKGLKVKDQGKNRLAFYDKDDRGLSGNWLTYDGLKCWDANGKHLDATLAYQHGQIIIDVNTANATYPVTIDPIIANGSVNDANALLQGFQAEARFGFSVASAGDVNGDGYSDVIVGAPGYDDNQPDQGAAFLFTGSSTGLSPLGFPYFGDAIEGAEFGWSVSSAGDVNGDGYSDVVVGSRLYTNGEVNEGAVYIFYGSAVGLSNVSTKIESNQAGALFGGSAASAGDINGDGYSDVIVGSPYYNLPPNTDSDGAAFILFGSANGIGPVASDTIAVASPNIGGGEFGSSASSAGDVNGDGFSDVIVSSEYYYVNGSNFAGAAFIYHGSQIGLPASPTLMLPGKTLDNPFADYVSSAGDLNADGYSDVLVGDGTSVYVYYGATDGSGISLQSEKILGYTNTSIACAGDVNADGYSDLVIADHYFDNNSGRALVFHGSKTGVVTTPKSTINGDQAIGRLGMSVASAGDVNGDGASDIIIGASEYDKMAADANDGIAVIYHGSAASVSAFPAAQVQAGQLDADVGYSVSDAGDVNGDGYADVIIGAPFYDNGQVNEGVAYLGYGASNGTINNLTLIEMNQANAHFGYSVSGAGDTNGDGYDDVIIGANLYDMGGNLDAGAGFVFYGSSSGIQLGLTNAVSLPQANAHAGNSVSSAGDINADGFDDIVVGAPLYDNAQNNAGAAIVSLGSAAGIATGGGTVIQGIQTAAEFGNAVSKAGDVNGDGYGDIIVGAFHSENNSNTLDEGGVFVYHGSKTGIETVSKALLELNITGAWLGYSVSDAGDVNGDGFDDVVAGAIYYANGQANEGAVAVYHGSASGVVQNAAAVIEYNQANALLGSSVSSADLNGDGYSDIIAGAPFYSGNQASEGAVLVYSGSETGIITSAPTVTMEGNQANCQMGYSASLAGDINGDGYDDLIAGAIKYTTGGRALIYHGNGDNGAPNYERIKGNIRLYQDDLTTLINQTNVDQATVGVGLHTKSFLGRNRAKLVWETRSQGQQFSHASPITNSTQFTGEGSFVNIQSGNTELKNAVVKPGIATRIRVRVKYDPVLAITGQVYGPWRYVNDPVITDPDALPVELISFKASVIENQVQLSWATATEVNSNYFEIQRSNNGKAWEKIGEVPALQNSSSNHHYTFSDANPLKGTSYYRLKMVDLDQTFAYSKLQSVKIKSLTTVYPNPVVNQLKIDSKEIIRKVNVFNSSGIKVMSVENSQGIGSIDLGGLPQGLYLIQSQDETFKVMKK
ncbi:FG-GAP-like repeat-containing protein [Dyadobacter bucti]|uniref:FG-GAP-like repeat-containing protein n=1 Tax=Dyadobacter bucti TaxID=2572203 RepID=UPI00140B5188|nr:FG-GAP-like repeat-containing protein [Dyadobacter bucti]